MTNAFSDFRPEDALEILERRKWWIAIAAVLGLSLGAVVYVLLPPEYEASTTILVEPQEIPQDFVQSTVTLSIDQRLRTLRERVTGHDNLNELIDAVGTARLDPEGNHSREGIMAGIRERLEVSLGAPQTAASVFNISYRDSDPELAAAVVREVADLFVAENIKDRAAQAAATAEFLDRELAKLRAELDAKEEELSEFKEGRMGALPDQLDSNLRELDRLTTSLNANLEAQTAARERIAALEQQMASGELAAPGGTSQVAEGSAASKLQELRAELFDMERIYTDEHPNVKRLRAEVERLEREVAENAERVEAGDLTALDPVTRQLASQIEQERLQLSARRRQEENLRERIDTLQARVEQTPALEAELQTLMRDIGSLRHTYAELLAKRHEAALAKNLETAQKGESFKVLRPAIPPRYPAFPSLVMMLPGGLAVGLALVALLVLGAEVRNPSFRSVARLTRTLGLPVIASVPRIDDDRIFGEKPSGDVDPRLVVHTASESAPSEQYRSFVPIFLEDEKRRVILVTSAARGDGKSLTCMNLALTVARDLNRRVLVIDGDLRRPTAHRLLRVRSPVGLADVLQRRSSLEEAAVNSKVPNLSLLPAGRSGSNPLTLITDKAFLEMLEHARTLYDAVFIDSPPLMPVVDTRLLRKLADLVVFVVRADATPRDAVVRSLQELREVAGVVFNEVSPGSFRRYYYYDAYSRYAYGEEESEREPEISEVRGDA